jgi:hypothetical protein
MIQIKMTQNSAKNTINMALVAFLYHFLKSSKVFFVLLKARFLLFIHIIIAIAKIIIADISPNKYPETKLITSIITAKMYFLARNK